MSTSLDRDPALDQETDSERDLVLRDYRIAYTSRQASLVGRREVLTGKAKFGIFGDGKELPQLAMARAFRPGDLRSGYYRDQTFMLAAGMVTVEQLFSQLYADPDPAHDPASSGRQMNSHFATHFLDADGRFQRLADRPNSVADSSPTASQMPRLVGLAYASKLYRALPELPSDGFSNGGSEIAFGTIGNASCAEGPFWEAINAVGVLGAPLLMSIWDDEYGISVPNTYQITKGDLSSILSGFQRDTPDGAGYEIYTVKGWDYDALLETYLRAARKVREEHVPAVVHVIELTQPQGHSTSGSHERYKSPERLAWEREHDGLDRLRQLVLDRGYASEQELAAMESEASEAVKGALRSAWSRFMDPIREEQSELVVRIRAAADAAPTRAEALGAIADGLERVPSPLRRHAATAARDALFALRDEGDAVRGPLVAWSHDHDAENRRRYGSDLYSEGQDSALRVPAVAPRYSDDSPKINGFEIINRCFDDAFSRMPNLIAFGEDLGQLGDVNQGFAGLQEKYGELRVADTGIRECTILGQAIGLAMRGLRPVAEIQYLDYIHYALQIISDDLATLRYRTAGRQKAPVIVRTRGHRLEGVWHSGSPMAGILNLVRGVYVCVPRDMTQAAAMYNTLLRSDDSAIVVEVLNGYRIKEAVPDNLADVTQPLGVPEVLRPGTDVTLVTYGACCRIALAAAQRLAECGVEVEVIDVQTLLPFDLEGVIGRSLRKTHRILFVDEDVPGGTTAYMSQQVLEAQEGFHWLDAPPRTLAAAEHRPAYGSDGDYWSKPNAEQIFDAVYELVHEAEPSRFPLFYR
ncbi:MAG: thiamine pyrophosphate-dependent enzyme [Acidobacteriota bacterium]